MRNELSLQLRCSPKTGKHTSHTCVFISTVTSSTVYFYIKYHIEIDSDLCYPLFGVVGWVGGGCFERFPLTQQHMTFNMAASSPAALREHID